MAGDKESCSKDVLGRVYEYFLGMFADTEGKRDGQFYTPRSIVRVLVEMIEPYHGRRGEVLFIDTRNMGVLRDHTHRELTDDKVQKIADTYHAWRGERVESGRYENVPGFCKAATLDERMKHDCILTPCLYMGFEETEDDAEEFEEKTERLTAELSEQFRKSE